MTQTNGFVPAVVAASLPHPTPARSGNFRRTAPKVFEKLSTGRCGVCGPSTSTCSKCTRAIIRLIKVELILETLDGLVAEGKIRWYGWSTDDPERARAFARGSYCTSVQQHLNVFGGSFETLKVCEELGLASLNRGPLMMGLLTGKFSAADRFPTNDVRHHWNFADGPEAELLQQAQDLREALTVGGRSPAQGALAWLWARSECTIPIPGFRTTTQVDENVRAMELGPLDASAFNTIEEVMGRPTVAVQ